MKLKVVHLIRRVERIDRDLEELENFQNTIHQDREYAVRLRDSLVEESMRLKKLRGRILAQVIRTPERAPEGSSPSKISRERSAIIPSRREGKAEIVIPSRTGSAAPGEKGARHQAPSSSAGGTRENITSRSQEESVPSRETRNGPAKGSVSDSRQGDSTKNPSFKFVFKTETKGG